MFDLPIEKESLMKIAYLILADNNPNHFKRLIRALDSSDSACFVHVDRKSNLDDFLMPEAANLHFCEDRIAIYWEEYSVVEATLRLMCDAINAQEQYDYCVLLSGNDYPLRSVRYIQHFFEMHRGMEFINAYSMTDGDKGKPLSRLTRYVPRSDQIHDPELLKQLNNQSMSANRDYKHALGDLQPYSGSAWWALTREACKYILDFVDKERSIVAFFENTLNPDEMFFQTLLANSRLRDKIRGTLTYADWSAGGKYPAVISDKHLAVFAKDTFGKLFARKFPDDSEKLVAGITEMTAGKDATAVVNERRERDRLLEPIAKAYGSLLLEPDFFFPWLFVTNVNRQNLDRYGEVYPREFYVFDAPKLVYLPIPKAACTSIKAALAKACDIVFAKNQSVHTHPGMHKQEGRLNAAQSGYYKFSFVRNPFERLVSCYRQKIIFIPSRDHPKPLYEYYFFSLPAHISFADFVERVAKIPDPLADNHFKSQYALLYSEERLQVDYVGKMENLDNEWKQIAEKYQLDPNLIQSNVTKDRQGCHSDYRLYYTEPLAKLVYERYRQDVETFGYERDYEHLLEFIRRR